MMKNLLLIVLLSLSVHVLRAADIRAVQNGNWKTTSTWNLNRLPTCGDIITIPAGITVSVTTHVDLTPCGSLVAIVDSGTMYFKPGGGKMSLFCGSTIQVMPGGLLQPGGGGGMASIIEICNIVYWSANDGAQPGPVYLGAPLPIDLLSFEAKCNGYVNITWSTATETNNDHFTLEKSTDVTNWDLVANISGARNSNSVINYQYTDENSLGGISYYRLSQTDFDGKNEIFDPVAVVCTATLSDDIIMYPIPFNEELNIQYFNLNEKKTLVKVYNMTGKIILTKYFEVTQGSNLVTIDLQNLASGLYYVEFSSGNSRYHQKVLKN
jgi:hypothetical protein